VSEKSSRFELPRALERLFAALSGYYANTGNAKMQRVIVNSSYRVHEEWDYDNWNGGQSGHALFLQLPSTIYYELFDNAYAVVEELKQDLNRVNKIPNEHISQVFLELSQSDFVENWRDRSGARLHDTETLPSSTNTNLSGIWEEGRFCLFLSHKSDHKQDATFLKEAMAVYGVSAFVAHEDIEPTREWQDEIEKALFSMDALAALITPGFGDSRWTDQEIGVAIGRRVPIIPIRLGCDPYGFIGKFQAVAGHGKAPTLLASELFELLWARISLRSRLSLGLVSAFEQAPSFKVANELMGILERIAELSPDLIERIARAPDTNSQVRGAFAVESKLAPFLQRLRGAKE